MEKFLQLTWEKLDMKLFCISKNYLEDRKKKLSGKCLAVGGRVIEVYYFTLKSWITYLLQQKKFERDTDKLESITWEVENLERKPRKLSYQLQEKVSQLFTNTLWCHEIYN